MGGRDAEIEANRAGSPLRPAAVRTVTLFGSGEPPRDVLVLAEELGRGIAERGWVLRNGGYGGTMEAAARGARSAGGRVVGVTCRAFSRSGPNAFCSETLDSADLFERLGLLIEGADAFAAFPGGTGTLTEVFLAWELMVKGFLEPRPLCLTGPGWEPWWRVMEADRELARRLSFLSRAATAAEALERLGSPRPASGGRSDASGGE